MLSAILLATTLASADPAAFQVPSGAEVVVDGRSIEVYNRHGKQGFELSGGPRVASIVLSWPGTRRRPTTIVAAVIPDTTTQLGVSDGSRTGPIEGPICVGAEPAEEWSIRAASRRTTRLDRFVDVAGSGDRMSTVLVTRGRRALPTFLLPAQGTWWLVLGADGLTATWDPAPVASCSALMLPGEPWGAWLDRALLEVRAALVSDERSLAQAKRNLASVTARIERTRADVARADLLREGIAEAEPALAEANADLLVRWTQIAVDAVCGSPRGRCARAVAALAEAWQPEIERCTRDGGAPELVREPAPTDLAFAPRGGVARGWYFRPCPTP